MINSLNEKSGNINQEYNVGENLFYVMRRLLGACLARDNKIKQNS